MDDSACPAGLTCDLGQPGGSCTMSCTDDSQCDSAGNAGACVSGVCYRACGADGTSPCRRMGYVCTDQGGASYCAADPNAGQGGGPPNNGMKRIGSTCDSD